MHMYEFEIYGRIWISRRRTWQKSCSSVSAPTATMNRRTRHAHGNSDSHCGYLSGVHRLPAGTNQQERTKPLKFASSTQKSAAQEFPHAGGFVYDCERVHDASSGVVRILLAQRTAARSIHRTPDSRPSLTVKELRDAMTILPSYRTCLRQFRKEETEQQCRTYSSPSSQNGFPSIIVRVVIGVCDLSLLMMICGCLDEVNATAQLLNLSAAQPSAYANSNIFRNLLSPVLAELEFFHHPGTQLGISAPTVTVCLQFMNNILLIIPISCFASKACF